MQVNENTVKGKWLEVRGNIQKAWGKLTNDELDQTKGDVKAIGGLIQQRYGEAQEKYGDKLNTILKQLDARKDEAVHATKSAFKN
jgi:uncharacterized protein YjbJ (UPF0337 family)